MASLFSNAANAQSYAITNARIVTVSGATIEKGTVKDLVERKLSLIEFGYFDDEDYKNRLMTLRDILFSLEEGYTLKTVEEMYRIKITGVFPEPLGSAISNLMEWEYRNNDKTNWKKAA